MEGYQQSISSRAVATMLMFHDGSDFESILHEHILKNFLEKARLIFETNYSRLLSTYFTNMEVEIFEQCGMYPSYCMLLGILFSKEVS